MKPKHRQSAAIGLIAVGAIFTGLLGAARTAESARPAGFALEATAYPLFAPESGDRHPAVLFRLRPGAPESTAGPWRLDIATGDGRPVRALAGTGWPAAGVAWDGRGADGRFVEAGAACVATVAFGSAADGRKAAERFKLGYALVARPDGSAVANRAFVFVGRRANGGLEFSLPSEDYQALRPLAETLARRPGTAVVVWAYRDGTRRAGGGGATEALRCAAKVRRGLEQFGLAPDRIRIGTAPAKEWTGDCVVEIVLGAKPAEIAVAPKES